MSLEDIKTKLAGLKELKECGLIDESDYTKEKEKLLTAFTSLSTTPLQPTPSQSQNNDIPAPTPTPAQPTTSPTSITTIIENPLNVHLTQDLVSNPCLIRLAVSGAVPHQQSRYKILNLVLDRSGSMAGTAWDNVIASVSAILKPDLLGNMEKLKLNVVVYASTAELVPLPNEISEIGNLLKTKYSPSGMTSFSAAFIKVEKVVHDLLRDELQSVPRDLIDISTLLFTDGEDTSIWEHGRLNAEKSALSAKKHSDDLKTFFKATGCDTFTYVAAFGSNHKPEQCQYFGDQYKYIDRACTLTQHLATLMGETLEGSGVASLDFQLPKSVSLAETVPAKLPLEGGKLDYHVWLKCDDKVDQSEEIRVELWVRGCEPLIYKGKFCPNILSADCLDAHVFRIDMACLQLRDLSRATSGVPSESHITKLRATLDEVRRNLQETRRIACAPYRNAAKEATIELLQNGKRSRMCGREVLKHLLQEVDTLADRLSHVVGLYAKGQVNAVQINAILDDSRQHLPAKRIRRLDRLAVTNADRIQKRREVLMKLPKPVNQLSKYGSTFTKDAYSSCDAFELSEDGDALFFQLGAVKVDENNTLLLKASDGIGFISYESFVFLKEAGMIQNKSAESVIAEPTGNIHHVWLPLFVTQEHFQRASLLLPDVLGRLYANDPLCYQSKLYQGLWTLLGKTMVQNANREVDWVMRLHKLRSLVAVGSNTPNDTDGQLLSHISSTRLQQFLQDPNEIAQNFYVFVADLFTSNSIPDISPDLVRKLVFKAWLNNAVNIVRNNQQMSAFQKEIRSLQWALFAPSKVTCNQSPIEIKDIKLESGTGQNTHFSQLFTLPSDSILEEVVSSITEESGISPHIGRIVELLVQISLKDKDTLTSFSLLEALNLSKTYECWFEITKTVGSTSNIWELIDKLMTVDDVSIENQFQNYVNKLKQTSENETAFPFSNSPEEWIKHILSAIDAEDTLDVIQEKWLEKEKQRVTAITEKMKEEIRRQEELLQRRLKLAEEHSMRPTVDSTPFGIHSTTCWCGKPFNEEHIRDVWGDAAAVDDMDLYNKARKVVFSKTSMLSSASLIDALTDKEYRHMGGTFTFGVGDTFIPGMHKRVSDYKTQLHEEGLLQSTSTETAIEEMKARLRWDDRVPGASEKLSKLLRVIWDVKVAGTPVPTILPSK